MAMATETMTIETVKAIAAGTAVFQPGKLSVEVTAVDHNNGAPKPVLIATPTDAGTYPVAVLLHGFFLLNKYYEQLLRHMASHGFIVVAPQLYTIILPNSTEDIKAAAVVTDWLPEGLPSALPAGVQPDLSKLALAGHSRGGHAAFCLALGRGAEAKLKFSALIGIDPVAGTSRSSQIEPKILTGNPSSLELGMPVVVIGTGLGDEWNFISPPCAPDGVNHKEFYYECKPPCYHFVTKEYGHLDMLDDDAPKLIACACKGGKNCKDIMRRTTAGIAIAFLRTTLEEQDGDLKAILNDPGLAPTTLDPAESRLA